MGKVLATALPLELNQIGGLGSAARNGVVPGTPARQINRQERSHQEVAMPRSAEIFEEDVVQRHFDQALSHYTAVLHDEFSSRVASAFSGRMFSAAPVESVTEAVFWIWWEAIGSEFGVWEFTNASFRLATQHEAVVDDQRYRLDFIVEPFNRHEFNERHRANYPKTAFELDGHAFHEKTLEQVTYRNQRDRSLQQAGWKVFHISFNELMNDPQTCVRDAYRYVNEAHKRFLIAAWKADESK